MWQGDRGHHSLPFLSFGKTEWNWKGGPQLPPRRPSLPPLPSPPLHVTPTPPSPFPASAWVDSLSRFSDLPCLCDTSVIVRGWQRTGSPGVDRAGLKVSSISLCMMDAARGPGHLKCTKQDGAMHTLLGPFAASALSLFNSPSLFLTHSYKDTVWGVLPLSKFMFSRARKQRQRILKHALQDEGRRHLLANKLIIKGISVTL